MKTISGHCVSVKDISLSKATKILSKFVSADNGASHGINAYLHRASMAFDELNQLHKDLELSRSHKKKHRTETGDGSGRVVENSARSVDFNQELIHGHVKSNKFGSENAHQDDEKSTPLIVKFGQELNGSIGYQAENVSGSEKHKKKKKKHGVETLRDGDSTFKFGEGEGHDKPLTGVQNEIEFGREQVNEGEVNHGMEEGKKQKSVKKKHQENTSIFSNNKGDVENVEGANGRGLEKHKEMKQSKKRKSDDVEERQEDQTGDLTKKRMKRKQSDDL
ncbi:hypothetical protein Fmac_031788 [Flemingia macrophylla]|uniref:Uncharacterized protein n=1 Tax=Flemingia macrophylla TaxID=520843 RepID=A0ABD1L323_9FABA